VALAQVDHDPESPVIGSMRVKAEPSTSFTVPQGTDWLGRIDVSANIGQVDKIAFVEGAWAEARARGRAATTPRSTTLGVDACHGK
jgi:hypothetical protein